MVTKLVRSVQIPSVQRPIRLFVLVAIIVGCLANPSAHAAAPEPPTTTDQATFQDQAAQRPNIVLILCDDLGYADVGFNGSTDILTPNLDRLSANGMKFSSAYVTHPFCGPSRMGLMSGRYPHKFGAPFNLPNSGLGIEPYNRQGVPEDQRLISSVLQDSGYFTGAIGKWHLGIDAPFHPNQRGFDEFYGFLGGGHMYFTDRSRQIYARQVKAGKSSFNEYIVPLQHNGTNVDETEYLTDGLSRQAVRFVDQASAGDQPFFLYMAYNAPHSPLEAKQSDLEVFAGIADEKRRTYAAMVYAVDRGVGQIVESLERSGTLDNTLVIFLSDNGGKIGLGANNAPLSQGKGSVSEGGFRVPMFFHWPDQIPAGKTFDHPVSTLDFYPTLSRLAGASIPSEVQCDGKDIWDSLRTNENPRQDEAIYALRHWNGFHDVAVRRNQWKVTKQGPSSPWKLFDLDRDISESKDVSDQHPELVRSMVDDARQWSQTHTQPRWYDNLKAEKNWKANGMPKYTSTFAVE